MSEEITRRDLLGNVAVAGLPGDNARERSTRLPPATANPDQPLPPPDDAIATDAISNDATSTENVRRRAASPATLLGLRA